MKKATSCCAKIVQLRLGGLSGGTRLKTIEDQTDEDEISPMKKLEACERLEKGRERKVREREREKGEHEWVRKAERKKTEKSIEDEW